MSTYLLSCWDVLVDSAFYMLIGFGFAGFLSVFINPQTVTTYFGTGRIRSVIYAALIGIPMPLCSCGVIPAAAGLKKRGATDGAAMSFLIATPETGVDSILLTYALLDPVMTIFRPFSAFVTAIAAGVTQNFLGNNLIKRKLLKPEITTSCGTITSTTCGCGCECAEDVHKQEQSLKKKFIDAGQFAFFELFNDIYTYFFIGIALAAAIIMLVPDSLMEQYLSGGIHSLVIMLLLSIPFYVCASASTPIAAALILKGMSPGAVLVFLLAGPATNMAAIAIILGTFGKKALTIYLMSIAVCSLIMGLVLDRLYEWFGLSAQAVAGTGTGGEFLPQWFGTASAVIFLALVGVNILKQRGVVKNNCEGN